MALETFFTITEAAKALDLSETALRARCRRAKEKASTADGLIHLGGGVKAFLFGSSWRIIFPEQDLIADASGPVAVSALAAAVGAYFLFEKLPRDAVFDSELEEAALGPATLENKKEISEKKPKRRQRHRRTRASAETIVARAERVDFARGVTDEELRLLRPIEESCFRMRYGLSCKKQGCTDHPGPMKTFGEIAASYDVSRERIRQIIKNAEAKIVRLRPRPSDTRLREMTAAIYKEVAEERRARLAAQEAALIAEARALPEVQLVIQDLEEAARRMPAIASALRERMKS